MMTRLTALVSLALAACGPKVQVDNPSVFEEDDPLARSGEVEKPRANDRFTPAPREPAPTELARVDLDRVLDEGPGNYIRSVSLEPVMDDSSGMLRGWQIVSWPYRWIDLRAGDVVLDVNGVLVVRPDDVGRLWQVLRGAAALEVRIERDGSEATLHLDVVDVIDPLESGEAAGPGSETAAPAP